MKIHTIVAVTLVSLFIGSFHTFGSPLDKQILKIKPEADRNGDGQLSNAEKAAMKKMIMKRYLRSTQHSPKR